MERHRLRSTLTVGVCVLVAATGLGADRALPGLSRLASGLSWPGLVGIVAGVMALCGIFTLRTRLLLARQGKPPVEGVIPGRLYWLLGLLAVLISQAYGFGVLGTLTTACSLFGGMLLGWSLQSPVSGLAAWVLVLPKQLFRPGDRVQFPTLGLSSNALVIGRPVSAFRPYR